MPKDLSKLSPRDLAELSGADDEDMLEEQWWARESEEEEAREKQIK